MKLLWLTNTDPNVAEDMLLLGLAEQGHDIEVCPWKPSFSWVADPAIQKGNDLTSSLSKFPKCTVIRPDVIVVTRADRTDGSAVYRILDEHRSVPVVYYDTEDKLTEPTAPLKERICMYLAAQTPADRNDIVAMPYGYRSDLVRCHETSRFINVSWGGTLQIGHGGRWELLCSAISLGLVQGTLSGCPASMWYALGEYSRASISIGGAQNAVAGVNARHFEIAALGARVLSYRHGIRIDTEVPEIEYFATAGELVTLCQKRHEPLSTEMILWNRRHNSHVARAEQFIHSMRDRGIVSC